MDKLENILEISMAIIGKKKQFHDTLPGIVEELLETNKSFIDLNESPKEKKEIDDIREAINQTSNRHDHLFKKKEAKSYGFFESFSEYVSMAKEKLYGYYSKIRRALTGIPKNNGYVDKLLNEIEDWGVIFFKPTFKKLERLTPQGALARYQQKLWLYVGKKVK